jgi:hypothetical protein
LRAGSRIVDDAGAPPVYACVVRVLLLVIGACLAIPAGAWARPRTKIAVAPLVGDAGGKVASAVVEALSGKDFTVIGPKEVGREIGKLGLPDELDGRSTRKLAAKLGVVAVIDGQVGRSGGKRTLHLEVHRRGKPKDGFTIEFKTTQTKGFRRGIHDEILKKIEGAGDDSADDEDEKRVAEEAERKRKAAEEDDNRKRKAAEDDAEEAKRKRKADDDDAEEAKRKRKVADEDDNRKRKADDDRRSRKGDDKKSRRVAADDDRDTATVRRRKRRSDDEASPSPLLVARVGAGASVAQRQLSWETRTGFTQAPPRVLTTAGGGRVDGEIYPFALGDPHSSLAALGLAAAYDKTFGLSIKVPNQTVRAPINQSHYALGVRYRVGIGDTASVALGVDYARRNYIAERGSLMGATLDTPDVDYTAVAPGAALRVAITDTIVAFGGADGMLMLETGEIQKSTSYGPSKVYGIEGAAGVDIAITKQIGVRVAVEYSQIMFSFNPKGSTLANSRDGDPATQDISGATDRSMGVAATLGLVY